MLKICRKNSFVHMLSQVYILLRISYNIKKENLRYALMMKNKVKRAESQIRLFSGNARKKPEPPDRRLQRLKKEIMCLHSYWRLTSAGLSHCRWRKFSGWRRRKMSLKEKRVFTLHSTDWPAGRLFPLWKRHRGSLSFQTEERFI